MDPSQNSKAAVIEQKEIRCSGRTYLCMHYHKSRTSTPPHYVPIMAHPFHPPVRGTTDNLVEYQEGIDRVVRAGIDDGYTRVLIICKDHEGADVIKLRRPFDDSSDAEEDRLGVLCVRFTYEFKAPTKDHERCLRLKHQYAALQQLRKRFGDNCEAVANSEGSDDKEIVRDYLAYTLEEIQVRVDHPLRVIYIPGIARSTGEEYCERYLRHNRGRTGSMHTSSWVEDYDLYRTLLEAWARRRLIPSIKYPAGWGRWLGKEYGRTMARWGPLCDLHGVQAPRHNPDSGELKARQQFSSKGLPSQLWGTLIVNLSHDTEELHPEDDDFKDKSHEKITVINLLIRHFGRDREAVVTNEGPEYHESVREYHARTLQQCLELVDHKLRILYIHRVHKEDGEGFCNRDLTEHRRLLHGLRKSAWVDSFDLLRILFQAWAAHHEPLFFLDTQGEMEPMPTPAEDDTAKIEGAFAMLSTASTRMTGDNSTTTSDVEDFSTTNKEHKNKWQRTG